jgi:NhaP-type Na+/H+ or K+/H+ antiporter
MYSKQPRQRSWSWYLLPAIVGVIGGVIAYYVLRFDDPPKAKNCLWLGIILSAIYFAYFVLFSLLIEFYNFS